jgi:hypothetical protein
MLIIESSEAREGTRLPPAVVRAGEVVVGLETLTGADFVISPLSEPKLPSKLRDCAPHHHLLKKHTQAGILVQRKSGLDLINSLGDLASIENRMLDWCGKVGPWLLTTGMLAVNKNRLILDGQFVDGNHSYKSVMAALDWWQLRGGGVITLTNDVYITTWVKHWHAEMLHKLGNNPERVVLDFPATQTLTDEQHWWTALASVPEIGPVRAKAVADWLPPEWQSMAHALRCLVDMENVNLPGKPKGVGPKTIRAVRDWLGIEFDEEVIIRKRNDPL